MGVVELFEEFRDTFPEVSKAADARHIEMLGSVEQKEAFLWFESLAGALNDQMGLQKRHPEISAVFMFFDAKFRNGNDEVRNCIDVSLVENLFWDVNPRNAFLLWAVLPDNLRQLYLDFHGRPPKLE